jgi:D-alanyl-D-alanine carboxypeptidase
LGFNKSLYPTNDPGSIWWVVDKHRPLPPGYEPSDLTIPNIPVRPTKTSLVERRVSQKIIPDLEAMVAAAAHDGARLQLASGYRSYALQVSMYKQNIKRFGQTEADNVSAKPGTSEHQTGFALDIGAMSRECEVQACFAGTPEGKWLAEHAYEYGFIIRYPEGKRAATGYDFEPWHLRYVGRDLAAELHLTGQTPEEFFGL